MQENINVMSAHFRMFARYNAWANELLYSAAARMTDADYRAERGAFFGSVHRTLNHLLAADRIWMRRFTGSGDHPGSLDVILFDDLASLTRARQAEDRRIIDWVEDLSEANLAAELRYRTMSPPAEVVQPLAPALSHFFNHHAHHRGQIHALITAAGGRNAAPSLDLIYFQRETGIGL